MIRIDENQESIARIRMAVDRHDEGIRRRSAELDKSDGGELPAPITTQGHWAIGSRQRKIDLGLYEEQHSENPAFRSFSSRLISFFREVLDSDKQLSKHFHVGKAIFYSVSS